MRVLSCVLIIGSLVLAGMGCGNDAVCVESGEEIQCYHRGELDELHRGLVKKPPEDEPYMPPDCLKCHQPATSDWADVSVRLRDYRTLRELARVEPLDLAATVD